MLTDQNYREIARIHKDQLKGLSLLSRCSVNFLAYFYQEASSEKTAFLVTESGGNQIIGFAFCTMCPEFLKRFFISHLGKLIQYPSCYLPIILAALKNYFSHIEYPYENELMFIAVDSHYLRKGAARNLLKQVQDEFKKNNIERYYLTVFNSNQAATRLYESFGFLKVGEFSVQGKVKIILRKDI